MKFNRIVWLLAGQHTRGRRRTPARDGRGTVLRRAASCAAYQPVPRPLRLSDRKLADAWSASYLALQEPLSTAERMRLIHERASYLAEFERRNAAGLTTWLASGATPASIPLMYVVERRAAYPSIDWDALISGQDS